MTSCVMGHTPTAGAVRALIAALAGEAKAARLPWLPGAGQRYMPAAAAVSVIANGGPVPNGAGSDAWGASTLLQQRCISRSRAAARCRRYRRRNTLAAWPVERQARSTSIFS